MEDERRLTGCARRQTWWSNGWRSNKWWPISADMHVIRGTEICIRK